MRDNEKRQKTEAEKALYAKVTVETDMEQLKELFSQPMGDSVPLQQILDELESMNEGK